MPDAIFSDPRLAALYDTIDGNRDDLDLYLQIAEEFDARHVLDVGCGTGSLAVQLAAAGRTVTAIDPAEASLQVARGKPGADRVHWRHGDATTLPPLGADLATMTGNVAQVFLTDDAWLATLAGIAGALRPGGRFVFETRPPSRRAWEEWAADTAPHDYPTADGGRVTVHSLGVDVNLPYVSFGDRFVFDDGTELESHSTLRFREQYELRSSLEQTGLAVVDIRDAPDRPGREWVFVTQRA